VRRIYRRRRKDYTPEQEESRKALHRAEAWLNIVSSGISDALKRDHYCSDGTREIIGFVNGELTDAVDVLEDATKAHDANFPERRMRAVRVVTVAGRPGKNPIPKPKKKATKT
jgi:hypothetical protein